MVVAFNQGILLQGYKFKRWENAILVQCKQHWICSKRRVQAKADNGLCFSGGKAPEGIEKVKNAGDIIKQITIFNCGV